MEQINTDQLKKAFHQEMINLCKRRNQELKYKSTRLLDFINKYGGYEAAVKYITTESNVQDFAILWEHERLDLSVEALITKPHYEVLFLEDILKYCDQKLKQYSYAPNKIEEEVEEEEHFEKMLEDVFGDMESEISREIAEIKTKAKPYTLYNKDLGITKEAWKELFIKTTVFSAKNQDLVLRVHLMGSGIEASDLASEEGYTATYPFKEVIIALAKRIKAQLKINAPVDKEGKIIWWHMLFLGGFKDNTCFEWTVRPELSAAIDELVAEGKVSLEGIHVKVQKTAEELPDVEPIEVEKQVEKQVEKVETAPIKRSKPQTLDELIDALIGPVEIEEVPETLEELEAKAALETQQSIVAPVIQPVEEVLQVTPTPSITEKQIEDKVPQEEVVDLIDYEKAKALCIEYYGAICDLCGFDYGYTYGEAFENQIQVHNIHAQDEVEVVQDTDPIKDLIPVCHNCHQIIHSQNPPVSVEQMRKMIKV